MRSRLPVTTCLFMLILLSTSPRSLAQQQQASPEALVRKVADQWMAAANSGDLESFMGVMAEDGIVLFPGSDPVVGAEAIRGVYRDYYATWKLDYEYHLGEALAADNLLIARATVEGSRTPKAGGDTSHHRFNNLWILKKGDDGAWKFWRAMFNEASSSSR